MSTNSKSQFRPIEEVILELQGMAVPELVIRYQALHGKPPRSKNRTWLWRRCAWKEQAVRFGGLSVIARKRIAELQAELQLPGLGDVRKTRPKRRSSTLPIGTRLEREWRGRTVVAVHLEEGWEVEGVRYRSLSAAAKGISGSHVSGPAFFGLRGKGAAR